MASMQRLQERLAGRPFAVLLVNHGEARMRVGEFVKREALGFPALLDPNQDASRAWRVRVLPSSFLVDAEGRVRYTVIGEMDWASQESFDTVQMLCASCGAVLKPADFSERPGDAASARGVSRLPSAWWRHSRHRGRC
jgi:hypothetical protein